MIDKCTLKIHQSMKTFSDLESVLYIIKYQLLNTVTFLIQHLNIDTSYNIFYI